MELPLEEYYEDLLETEEETSPSNLLLQDKLDRVYDNRNQATTFSNAMPVAISKYTESGHSVVNGSAVKVSPDAVGPADITYGTSVSISESFSVSGSATTESIKQAVRAGAGFTWTKSVSTSASFNVKYSVPKGRTGYIKFTPRLNKTVGTYTVKYYLNNRYLTGDSSSVTAYSPIKLSNGHADGTYALVLR